MASFPQFDWTAFYGDVEEAIPVDMSELLGKDVDVRMMCDSDHAWGQTDQTFTHWFPYLL